MSVRGQAGFTLLETLIAVVVISIGMLGAASMQLLSLRTSNQGLLRSQATLFANDLAERLRANQVAVFAGLIESPDFSGGYCTTTTNRCDQTAYCSASELAAFDLFQIGCERVQAQLPGGELQVSCDTEGANRLCAITVFWSELARTENQDLQRQRVDIRIQP